MSTNTTSTLTSLAILRVHINQGSDYLNYLVPFVYQILLDNQPNSVSVNAVRVSILKQFGLEIPGRSIQLVLRRLTKKHILRRESNQYAIVRELPHFSLQEDLVNAKNKIQSVASELVRFSKQTRKALVTNDQAIDAICAFLSRFDVDCLRAYLRGTAIPNIMSNKNSFSNNLVSNFVIHLQNHNQVQFEKFMIFVQGHMLANALLCPDLPKQQNTYNDVKFFIDTPMLINLLGLDGKNSQKAASMLLNLLHELGAHTYAFSHTREELVKVILAAAEKIDSLEGYGRLVMEARRSGKTKSDFIILAGKIDESLAVLGIKSYDTPPFNPKFQIDEKIFESILNDQLKYQNQKARYHDINSLRSIYTLRRGITAVTIEKCRAILVTRNRGVARAAWIYGRDYEHDVGYDVSGIISDFALANFAWLKSPVSAVDLPMAEVLAYSYAALQPSKQMLDKIEREISRLQESGQISVEYLQLLRGNPIVLDEMMRVTLGDENEVDENSISSCLEQALTKLQAESTEKIYAEQKAHRQTQKQLRKEREKRHEVAKRIDRKIQRQAKVISWTGGLTISFIVLFAWIGGYVKINHPFWSKLFLGGGILWGLLIVMGSNLGLNSLQDLRQFVQRKIYVWLWKKKTRELGIDPSGVDLD